MGAPFQIKEAFAKVLDGKAKKLELFFAVAFCLLYSASSSLKISRIKAMSSRDVVKHSV